VDRVFVDATGVRADAVGRGTEATRDDPSYFGEIYIMRADADGSGRRRLTNVPGYDGGPFFSPDGKRIIWRRFDERGLIADVWTMNLDGTDQRQITDFGAMSWAPYIHPSGRYIVFRRTSSGSKTLKCSSWTSTGPRSRFA
jgi:Tol biopolymer transport system component